jgi:hypothetical protein
MNTTAKRPVVASLVIDGGALSLLINMRKSIPQATRDALKALAEKAAEDARGRIVAAAASSAVVPDEADLTPRYIGSVGGLDACLEMSLVYLEEAEALAGSPINEERKRAAIDRANRAAQGFAHLGVSLGLMGLDDDTLETGADGQCPICGETHGGGEEGEFSLSDLLKGNLGERAGFSPRPFLRPSADRVASWMGPIIAALIAKAAAKAGERPATGGTVSPGKSSTVGEAGPEAIIPKGDARYGAGEAEFPHGLPGAFTFTLDLGRERSSWPFPTMDGKDGNDFYAPDGVHLTTAGGDSLADAAQAEVDRVAGDMDRAMGRAVRLTDATFVERLYNAARALVRSDGSAPDKQAERALSDLGALVDEVEGPAEDEDPFAPPPGLKDD